VKLFVDREIGIEIWRGIIEALNSVSIKSAKRKAIYQLLFEVFEQNGFDAFDELVSGDDTIDKAYDAAFANDYE
jgi:hypothetical protein